MWVARGNRGSPPHRLRETQKGQQLYLYALTVDEGDVTPPRTVDPLTSEKTGELLPGGGTEYVTMKPIPQPQREGVPVRID